MQLTPRGLKKPDITDAADLQVFVGDNMDTLERLSNSSPHFINGTGTVSGTWLGNSGDITSYYDGMTVLYKIPIAGATTTTLNINGLGAKTIYRYGSSKLTTHYPVDSVLLLIYSESLNGGCFMTEGSDYDSTESYTVRWNSAHKVGDVVNDYKLVMFGVDGLLYPLTIQDGTGTTKTVSTVEFAIDSPVLYYGSTTNLASGATTGTSLYNSVSMSTLHYTANQASGFTAYKPIYLKGTITPNGNFRLDNTSYTSWLTQDLPTTDDGFVYMLLGYMYSTTTSIRLTVANPIIQYKDGMVREYIAPHTHDLLDIGMYSSYGSIWDSTIEAWTVVDYKRPDGTLYMKSTLSNPDVNGYYQTDTWNFYDTAGTAIISTKTWTITYDSNGNISSKVVS